MLFLHSEVLVDQVLLGNIFFVAQSLKISSVVSEIRLFALQRDAEVVFELRSLLLCLGDSVSKSDGMKSSSND